MTKLKNSASMVWVADANDNLVFDHPYANPGGTGLPFGIATPFDFRVDYRHNAKSYTANYLFLDGHVEHALPQLANYYIDPWSPTRPAPQAPVGP